MTATRPQSTWATFVQTTEGRTAQTKHVWTELYRLTPTWWLIVTRTPHKVLTATKFQSSRKPRI